MTFVRNGQRGPEAAIPRKECVAVHTMTDQVNCAKVNAACSREGALGYCAREYALEHEGFVEDKGTSKDAAAFMNSAG